MEIEHLKPLLQNKIFLIITSVPILVGLIMGLVVWSPLPFSFTANGYENFLKLGTLPLSIMGVAIPLGGFYGLLHKSKQVYHQELNSEIRREYDKYLSYFSSVDAILILLYRISNHTEVLKNMLKEKNRNDDQIQLKLRFILDNWSSFYTEHRFMPAMRFLNSKFDDIDSVLCGFEKGIGLLLEINGAVLDSETLDIITEKLSILEKQVIDHRKSAELEYENSVKSICALYGEKPVKTNA
ncbi:hypothetical protein [Shewanella frigidimarina]|uniref:hypothetical protein n=1 Tax=Shewanella frigidimarina TaxID=56812 RepID=UPI003D790F9C